MGLAVLQCLLAAQGWLTNSEFCSKVEVSLCNSTILIQIQSGPQSRQYKPSRPTCHLQPRDGFFCLVKVKKGGKKVINSTPTEDFSLYTVRFCCFVHSCKSLQIQLWYPVVPFSFYYSLCACVWACASVSVAIHCACCV